MAKKRREEEPFEDGGELISTGRKRKHKEKAARTAKNKAQSAQNPKGGKVRIDLDEQERSYNKYYLAVANRYRYARYAAFIVLVAFLLTILIFYRGSITYSNLMYLIRDLDSDTEVSVGVYSDVTYDEVHSPRFAMFRSRIALASQNGLRLYSSAGGSDISDDTRFFTPQLETGEKYALVYDAGSTGYCLYTTVSRVFSGKTDENIEDGCVADDGSFALMTRSDDAKFVITVYGSDFKARTKYYKDKYVMDIALCPDGSELCALSADVSAGGASCEIMLGSVGTEDSKTVSVDGLMPICARYCGDGTLIVICDGAVLGISNGEIQWKKDFSGAAPMSFDINGGLVSLCCTRNAVGSENEVFVFDTAGNILYNDVVNGKISFFVTDGVGTAYAVGEDSAEKTVLSDGTKSDCAVKASPIAALCPPGNLILCYADGTVSYFTGE